MAGVPRTGCVSGRSTRAQTPAAHLAAVLVERPQHQAGHGQPVLLEDGTQRAGDGHVQRPEQHRHAVCEVAVVAEPREHRLGRPLRQRLLRDRAFLGARDVPLGGVDDRALRRAGVGARGRERALAPGTYHHLLLLLVHQHGSVEHPAERGPARPERPVQNGGARGRHPPKHPARGSHYAAVLQEQDLARRRAHV